MNDDFEGGSTSLSALMNNNPPPMNTNRHMPENTIGQGGPVSMRDVYDKRGGPGNYDMPPLLDRCKIYLLHNKICKIIHKLDNLLKRWNLHQLYINLL